jgi:hypothetical protein
MFEGAPQICGKSFKHQAEINPTKSSGTSPDIVRRIKERPTQKKFFRKSPPSILAEYLDIDRPFSEKLPPPYLYDEDYKYATALPTILVDYMYTLSRPRLETYRLSSKQQTKGQWDLIATQTLERQGLIYDDVAEWAWILSPSNNEEVAKRFLSSEIDNPPFLLLEVLRRDIPNVRTLKLLLIYVWDLIVGKPRSNDITSSETEVDATMRWSAESIFYLEGNDSAPLARPTSVWEETTFTLIWTRLLHHARRLWSPALVSMSHMVGPIICLNYGIKPNKMQALTLDKRTHHRASVLLNHMIRLLSLPAATEPFISKTYAWKAQKVLLKLAGEFEPPLILNQASYRSIAGVLVGQKKSSKESNIASLRRRSWPPWRIDQDGMDAQRPIEDDFTRVVLATLQTIESGYQEHSHDRALKIEGGQDPDGTPTIQTRRQVTWLPPPFYSDQPLQETEPNPTEWTARVLATRDVQEAWSAFSTFKEKGGTPSLRMYHAMFEKLEFELKRSRRSPRDNVSPGDGMELIPPSNDNFSKYYQQILQPPTKEKLYMQMIEQSEILGHRPSGRFLNFLVANAKDPVQGLQHLQDSRMDGRIIKFLVGDFKEADSEFLKTHLQDSTLSAFITLLVRFTPRAVSTISDPTTTTSVPESDLAPFSIREFTRPNAGKSIKNPLRHAIQLLERSQTRYRPAWYALFEGLSRSNVVIDREFPGDPKNDLLSWRVLVAALDDFHNNNLELDPRGFLIICQGLEKAILASFSISDKEKPRFTLDQSGIILAVKEFKKMTEVIVSDDRYKLPQLLHGIRGVHLHAYVRILGLVNEDVEMISLLEWMVENHKSLTESSNLVNNGPSSMRKVFVAMRVFLKDTDNEVRAEELVNSIETWGRWPSEDEAQEYLRWPSRQDDHTGDDIPKHASDFEELEDVPLET